MIENTQLLNLQYLISVGGIFVAFPGKRRSA